MKRPMRWKHEASLAKSNMNQDSYRWHMGRHVTLLLCLVGLPSMLQATNTLPFVETFEDSPSYMANSNGTVHGQHGWEATPTTNWVLVQTNTVYAGTRAAMIATNASMWHSFSGVTDNVWIDFYAIPVRGTTTPTITNDVAVFYVNTDGHVVARSTNQWIELDAYDVPTNEWTRFTVYLDYSISNWHIYAAGDTPNELSTMLSTNLSFSSTGTNTYFTNFKVEN